MRAVHLVGAVLLSACAGLTGIEDVEAPAFDIQVAPADQMLTQGRQVTFAVHTTRTSGQAESVTLALGDLPAGVQATLDPASIMAGDSATLTVAAAPNAAEVAMTITVTATTVSQTHTAAAQLTIVEPNDFVLGVTPQRQSVAAGATATYGVSTHVSSGRAEDVVFSASGLPDGISGAFDPPRVKAGESSNLILTASATTAAIVDRPFTISATAASATHTGGAWVTVTNDFGLAISGEGTPLRAGGVTRYRITGAATSGPPQTIALVASGLPEGVTASFAPATIVGSATSTLTLVASPKTAPGTSTLTVTGTAPSGQHAVTASLTIGPPYVVNGDFGTGTLTGWTSDDGGTVVIDDSGNWRALVGADYGASALVQAVDIPATGTTNLAASVWRQCGDPDVDGQGLYFFDGSRNLVATAFSGCFNEQAWERVMVDLSPFAGQQLQMVFFVYDQEGAYTFMIVDDVAMTNQ